MSSDLERDATRPKRGAAKPTVGWSGGLRLDNVLAHLSTQATGGTDISSGGGATTLCSVSRGAAKADVQAGMAAASARPYSSASSGPAREAAKADVQAGMAAASATTAVRTAATERSAGRAAVTGRSAGGTAGAARPAGWSAATVRPAGGAAAIERSAGGTAVTRSAVWAAARRRRAANGGLRGAVAVGDG